MDLFSGTGSATEAFRRSAGWTVITVDTDKRRRPDVISDVRSLPISTSRVDFIWASPPCTEFSLANPSRPLKPSLELVFAALDAVRSLRPRFWILENVTGLIPFLGIPVCKAGPFCLWGYFPPLRIPDEFQRYRKSVHRSSIRRAAIPFELSQAVYQAVEKFWDIPRLLDMRAWPHKVYRNVRTRDENLNLSF